MLLAGLSLLLPALHGTGPLHREALFLDHITFNHLAVAKNLSSEHGWVSFYRRGLNADGELVYRIYNRFPPLGYGLIKLAILAQPGELAAQVQAARMLMLVLYAAAAVLAYFALVEVIGRRWFALGATLIAFGSYTALRACDMVATEGAVDLFGTMLAFHGVARYHRRPAPGVLPPADAVPRLGQLLAKSCAALLLGWHVYGLLAPFVVLGLAAALLARDWPELRRLLLFGVVAFLFGLAVLAQNFVREHLALDAEEPFWALPSFESMKAKSVFFSRDGQWLAFAIDQLRRAGLAMAPYAATRVDVWWPGWAVLGALGYAVVGVGALLAVAPAASAAHRRVQTASRALVPLALAGLVWAIGMRGNLFSYQWTWGRENRVEGWDIFEAMFHVGVPLAAASLLALLLPIRLGPTPLRRLAAVAVVAALFLGFAASALHMGQLGRHPEVARQERIMLADLDAARRILAGRSVFPFGSVWPAGVRRHAHAYASVARAAHFYFANHVLFLKADRAGLGEFVLAPRIRNGRTLTPDNRFYFLYGIEEYLRRCGAPRRCQPADHR